MISPVQLVVARRNPDCRHPALFERLGQIAIHQSRGIVGVAFAAWPRNRARKADIGGRCGQGASDVFFEIDQIHDAVMAVGDVLLQANHVALGDRQILDLNLVIEIARNTVCRFVGKRIRSIESRIMGSERERSGFLAVDEVRLTLAAVSTLRP